MKKIKIWFSLILTLFGLIILTRSTGQEVQAQHIYNNVMVPFTVPAKYRGTWKGYTTKKPRFKEYFKITKHSYGMKFGKKYSMSPLKKGTYANAMAMYGIYEPWGFAGKSGKRIVSIPNGGGDGSSFYRSGKRLMFTIGTIKKNGKARKNGIVTTYRCTRIK